jgi:carotenoid 1,2-hydratase
MSVVARRSRWFDFQPPICYLFPRLMAPRSPVERLESPSGPVGSFATDVPPGGYAWWYVDAISGDGQRMLTAIFFIGSVFSPSYAARIRRGELPRAEEYVAVNLALYERGRNLCWVMSEYGESALLRSDALRIAGSSLERRNGRLQISIQERSAPFMVSLAGVGRRVSGTISLSPLEPALPHAELATAGGHRHAWSVEMPRARVEVRFDRPGFCFDGIGYHDANRGEGRLEDTFARWSWARFHGRDQTTILYSIRQHDGLERAFFAASGMVPREVTASPSGELQKIGWGLSLPRSFSVGTGEGGGTMRCHVTAPLERAPFYARYLAQLETDGAAPVAGLGEYLDLDRFRSQGRQFLLRFKTRRG